MLEAWDTGAERSRELNEDDEPPDTKSPIPLVCQTCQTCLVSFSVQYTYVFIVKHGGQIHTVVLCESIAFPLGSLEK